MKQHLLILLLIVVLFSCIEENSFDLPQVTNTEPNIDREKITTFNSIVNRYNQAINNGETYLKFNEDEELYIEGYVISDDSSGNFYKELIISGKSKLFSFIQENSIKNVSEIRLCCFMGLKFTSHI